MTRARAELKRIHDQLSYANVTATIALFLALGGTSYAVARISSDDIVDNSIRSRDVRDSTLRGKDIRDRTLGQAQIRRNSLGSTAIRESLLAPVPRARNADRLGGATEQDLKVRCPADTVLRAGVCIETSPKSAVAFFVASDQCSAAGRAMATFQQLDSYARSNGPLPAGEWTSSVYRNTANGPNPRDELEAVVVSGFGDISFDRVYTPAQHAFRCVAPLSN